jgi:hypothetical protein
MDANDVGGHRQIIGFSMCDGGDALESTAPHHPLACPFSLSHKEEYCAPLMRAERAPRCAGKRALSLAGRDGGELLVGEASMKGPAG